MADEILTGIVLIIIAIVMLILGPVLTIIILNFLLSQMFVSYIPLAINFWNWLAFFVFTFCGFISSVGRK